jgi:predicted Rossmann fold nucleotide-binding protein DprA/Smf involved in DNA uptake
MQRDGAGTAGAPGLDTGRAPGEPVRAVPSGGARTVNRRPRCCRLRRLYATSHLDEDTRDVLAGLSSHLGLALPAALIRTATPPGSSTRWADQGNIAGPADDKQVAQQLRELGRTLRQRATAAGISMLVHCDAGWPSGTGCDDLPCLWVRGNTDIAALLSNAVAVTGARASTNFGQLAGTTIAGDLADAGWTVVTGAGFGIEAHAAATALSTTSAPVLLTATGLDHRHADPIASTIEQTVIQGAVISPFPPGTAPTRPRFWLRSHLLGTLAVATVLVEAAVRSQTKLAVRAAASTGRVACAVPGPVTSALSANCRELIADGTARLVTDARDVLTAISKPGGSTPGEDLYVVRAVAIGLDGPGVIQQVPPFTVQAPSHAHAANTLFDVLLQGHRGPVELHAGVHDPAGRYEAITISVKG